MKLITFIHLGKDVKITVEGNRCMNADYEDDEQLAQLQGLNNVLLNKEDERYAELFDWCCACFHKCQRGRETFFAV